MDKHKTEDQFIAEETDTAEIVEQVEHRKPYQEYIEADLGLRNHWHAVMFGRELAEGELRGEMVLGERLVFKRAGRKVYAMEDRCPHRGASFSARPECYSENTVTCWFHGFTFDVRDGQLVQILTEPDSKLIGKLKHKTYPVQEINGVVFVFIGDLEPVPDIREDLQPEFFKEGLVVHPVVREKVRANWRIAAENGYDAAHIYGHRNSGIFSEAGIAVPLSTYPSTKEAVQILDEETGPWGIIKDDDVNIWSVEVEGQEVKAVNFEHQGPPPDYDISVGLYMPCCLVVSNFPIRDVYHLEWYTPLDEDHHFYMIAHATVAGSEEEAAQFRQDCDQTLGPMVWKSADGQTEPVGDGAGWGFNNFDAFGREQIHHSYQYEDFWYKERLYRPDYIIVRWRMLVAKHMRGIQKRGEWADPRGWSPDGRDYAPRKNSKT